MLSLSHVFGSPRQSLGRSVVGRRILHVPVPDPSSSGARFPPCSALVFGCGAPSSRPAASLDRQPGLAAPGAVRRRWPCLGGTLGPHRYRGITLTRDCASPPCVSGFSMVRPQLLSLGGASLGTAFVRDLLCGCVPGQG